MVGLTKRLRKIIQFAYPALFAFSTDVVPFATPTATTYCSALMKVSKSVAVVSGWLLLVVAMHELVAGNPQVLGELLRCMGVRWLA